MNKKRLILIAGWAHPGDALSSVAAFLANSYDVTLTSVAELAAQGSNGKQAAAQLPMDCYAAALKKLVERAGGECVLVGWSMGAMAALESVAEHKLGVDGIVAISATARFTTAEGYPFGFDPSLLRAFRLGLVKQAEVALRGFLGDVHSPFVLPADMLAGQARTALSLGSDVLEHGLRYLEQTDLRSMLSGVKQRVLAIHGRQDRIIPWQAGEHLAKSVANGKFVAVDEAGHSIVLTHADSVAWHIRRFMDTT